MPPKPLHPTFQGKSVMKLCCRFCSSCVCQRGMKAVLLADTTVELFSTDALPDGLVDSSAVLSVNKAYQTEKCKCIIKDVACLVCGNILGYSVILPCRRCLESCNNGHYLMFYSGAVHATERLDSSGNRLLLWGSLEDDELQNGNEEEDELDYLR